MFRSNKSLPSKKNTDLPKGMKSSLNIMNLIVNRVIKDKRRQTLKVFKKISDQKRKREVVLGSVLKKIFTVKS